MNETTRKTLHSSARGDWETPRALFDQLNQEFHFTLDAAASDTNHLCPQYYTEAQDSLSDACPWTGVVWVNPPYGRDIDQWIRKGLLAFTNNMAEKVVMLLPARTDTKWFHDYLYNQPYVAIRFIRGRLKFCINGVEQDPAPFPSMLVIIG